MLVSVVVTVKNEAESMPQLLDSLMVQEKPFEIIIVDANSDDGTPDIVKDYALKHKEVKFYSYDETRGESRNYGVKKSKGAVIAFTDGNCVADKNWLKEIRGKISEGYDIVAGKTNRVGSFGFQNLARVGIYHKGGDASFPTCNIAYKKSLFEKIDGFDSWFKEAEDVDINFRALDAGAKMVYDEKAIINHMGAETPASFIKKSFWYGFGRKELNIRHGALWSQYNIMDIIKLEKGESLWKFIRLPIAFLGYVFCIFVGKKPEAKQKLRKARISQH